MALTNKLTAIGDAIRAKTGDTAKLTLDEMAAEIADIPAPVPGSDVYTDYAINGLDTISEDIEWPTVRERAFSNCEINAQLKNLTSVKQSGFSGARIYAPQDFSKVANVDKSAFESVSFFVKQDTTYSFDALQTIAVSYAFAGMNINHTNNQTTSNITFDFPNLVSIAGDKAFGSIKANTYYINTITLNYPVLTKILMGETFSNLGYTSTYNTEYIVNLPELTTTPSNVTSVFSQNSYRNDARHLRIYAPKLATITQHMFLYAYLRELTLDWNNITSISYGGFSSAHYENGMFPNLPSVTTIEDTAFAYTAADMQDSSTTPYVWKIGGREPVFVDKRAFRQFALLNKNYTYRPLLLDFPSGLTDATFTKGQNFYSTSITSPISIVIRNSTVPTLTYSPISSSGIFGGALQPGQQVYVPRALLEDYKAATNWSVIANNIVAIEDYPDLLDQ